MSCRHDAAKFELYPFYSGKGIPCSLSSMAWPELSMLIPVARHREWRRLLMSSERCIRMNTDCLVGWLGKLYYMIWLNQLNHPIHTREVPKMSKSDEH